MQNATNHIKRELQLTADGSHTLFIPEMDEHYHSVNGAVQESRHVFIEAGLHHLERKEIVVLEIGFGTGLNAFLTLLDAEVHQRKIHYYSVELYPLDMDVIESLNYGEMICAGRKDVFQALHQAEWNVAVQVTDFFGLHKIQGDSIRVLCRIGSTWSILMRSLPISSRRCGIRKSSTDCMPA